MADKNDNHENLLDEVQDHYQSSDSYLSTLRDDWDDLEAMLIVRLTDSLTNTTNNKIFDPILSSIVYERAARVMAQNPKGKAYAQSSDDVGKNMLMNLLLKYYYKNATEQDSMLVKLRLWDLYSLVYGSMFALVPWRVNQQKSYIGPELNILPIRDCFPQPTKSSVPDMDWFTVRNVVSIDWLKQQDPDVWDMEEIEALDEELRNAEDGGDTEGQSLESKQSYVERTFFPSTFSDVAYPQVEMLTEYRKDKWITWTPQRIDSKTSQPRVLRVVGNEDKPAYPDYKLPIVGKHAFPLIDSPIGFGEFARGKSLQMGINSLWNLYMQGVKYSIFPPLHINPENVVPSSIKWGAGEFWFMDHPNKDIQPMQIRPNGIETFHSTYGALKSAIESQAGTSSVRESADTKSSLGKTPQAIAFIARKEDARDEWDRVMMEQAIEKVYERWISLTVENMEEEVHLRLFEDEIQDIEETHPDVVELYKSGKRGEAKIKKNDIDAAYDFILETGSTVKPDLEAEQKNITSVLKAVLENPAIIESLQAEGKSINIPELFKRWLQAGGIKDYDKIVVEKEPVAPEAEEGMEQIPPELQEQMMGGGGPVPQGAGPVPQQPMPQGGGPVPAGGPMPQGGGPQINPDDFQDPDIRQAVMELMNRMQQ